MTSREKEILEWIQENPLISQEELAKKANIARSSVAVHISNLIRKGFIQGRGYVLQTQPYAVVIGGANMDIAGISFQDLLLKDSNPGRLNFSMGGVGRNIADNLSRLDVKTELLTLLGKDINGENIRMQCQDLGIGMNYSQILEDGSTSCYLSVLDETGDMVVAIADMGIYDRLDIAFIKERESIIRGSSLCIVDTNLPEETLRYIVENFDIPVFLDPVSTAKSLKVKDFIGKFHTIKPNRIEAEKLLDMEIKNDVDLERAVLEFLKKGVKNVFISLGEDGIFYGDNFEFGKIEAKKQVDVVNTTGAGDAFMAGIAQAFLQNRDIHDAVRNGIAASLIAIVSEETINKNMSIELLDKYKEDLL